MLFVRRTTWSTPCSRATSIVRSVEPSSMTSHSTSSKPSTSRGRSRRVAGRVSSSFRQGIWMIELHAAAARQYRRGSGGSSDAANLARRMSAWRSRLLREGPALALLAGISVVALVLRYQHSTTACPTSTTSDEGSHFTARAVAMFGGDREPALLPEPVRVHLPRARGAALRVRRLVAVRELRRRHPALRARPDRHLRRRRARSRPLLCIAGVVAVFSVGRRLWDRRTGLVAAAVLAFAFLPVTYSRIAVTDVGMLAPVALVAAVARCGSGGRARCAGARLAGAAAGRGDRLQVHGRARAAAARGRRRWRCRARAARRAALGGLAASLAVALVAFFVTNPYFFLDLSDAHRQLSAQADRPPANGRRSSARTATDGFTYYLGSSPGASAGSRCSPRWRARVIERGATASAAVVLLIFPLALFVYLSLQARFFGRWLLPAYPVFALLAGVAVTHRGGVAARTGAAARASRRWRSVAAAARVAVGRRRRALDGGARPPRHAPVAREWLVAHTRRSAARRHRAGRPGALLPPAPEASTRGRRRSCAGSSRHVRPRRGSSTAPLLKPARASTGTASRATAGDDDEPDRGPQRRARSDPDALAYYDAPEARVEARLLRQPVPVRREAAAVRLRPLLQLLLATPTGARARRSTIYRLQQLQAGYGGWREPAAARWRHERRGGVLARHLLVLAPRRCASGTRPRAAVRLQRATRSCTSSRWRCACSAARSTRATSRTRPR